MPTGEAWQLALIVLLIGVNGFFAMAEIALVTVRPTQVNGMVERRLKGAERLARLIRDPSRFLSTIQVGITLSGFLASASATVVLARPVAGILAAAGIPAAWSKPIAIVVVTAFVSFLSLVFGELVPKQLALQAPQRLALRVVSPVEWLSTLLRPFVAVLSASTSLVLKLFHVEGGEGRTRLSEEELRRLVAEHRALEDDEKEMIESVFEFGDIIVREIMVPRGQVAAVEVGTSVKDAAALVRRTGFSRFPVFKDDLDDVVGVLTAKDVLYAMMDEREQVDVEKIARPALFVPEVKSAFSLLQEVRRHRVHLVVVLDEYGGTAGIVTVEDLLEQIVGDIRDETDPASNERIVASGDSEFVVDAGLRIEEVNEHVGVSLGTDDVYETLAGFLLAAFQRIPAEGDSIRYGNVVFTIDRMDHHRIQRVHVKVSDEGEGESLPGLSE